MKKYIYGKFNAATVPQTEINDFHSLSMFLGAYLLYSENPQYSDFKEYAKDNHLLYNDNQGKCFWSCVNKGQIFIRDKINQNSSKDRDHISRRQIRKLGYSGTGSVRMYPLSGNVIQETMFRYVFEEKHLAQVRELYLDFLFEKWNDSEEPQSFLSIIGGKAADENTFKKFLFFQYKLLASSPNGERIIETLIRNATYKTIRQELDERG